MAQGDTLGVVMQSDIGSGASGGVAAQAQISGIFSATATYAVGAYVVYNGLLYRCTTPHSGAWDASHFTQVTIGGELNTRTPVYGGGVNLLDNWYFIGGGSQQGGEQFPINQRGQTSYSGVGYGIDMWVSSVPTTIIVTTNGVSIVASEASVGNIIQRLSGLSKYLGKTYTASILTAEGVLVTGIVTFPATASGVVIVGTVYFTGGRIEIGYNTERNWMYFNIIVNANTTVTIKAAKLELGTQQTLAHQDASGNWVLNDTPPNYQQELAKCQRYFQVFRDQNLRPAYGMDYRPPMAKEQPTQSSFVLDGVTYYTASAEL